MARAPPPGPTPTGSTTDRSPGLHTFRLKQIDFDGSFAYSPKVNVAVDVPGGYFMADAYPNPFNPSTTIDFTINATQTVQLAVYNAQGRLMQVAFEGHVKSNARQTTRIDGASLPSGVYPGK